jgi:pantoate kinase
MPTLAALPLAEQRAFHHRIGLIMSRVTVNQVTAVSEAQISPKSLAMLGASIFILKGLESKESLTFVLSANDNLEFRDNELTTSFEEAKKALLSFTEEQIRSVLDA